MTRSYPNAGPNGLPCIWSVRGHERFYLKGKKRIFVMVVTIRALRSFFWLGRGSVRPVGAPLLRRRFQRGDAQCARESQSIFGSVSLSPLLERRRAMASWDRRPRRPGSQEHVGRAEDQHVISWFEET
jgi:hypothetical protein